jgi:hypothetical protein
MGASVASLQPVRKAVTIFLRVQLSISSVAGQEVAARSGRRGSTGAVDTFVFRIVQSDFLMHTT